MAHAHNIFLKACTLLLLGSFLAGCATTQNQKMTGSQRDPWEGMNRSVFNFNESFDDSVAKPIATGYKKVMPVPVARAVGNFFSNLNDVVVIVNDVLQFKFPEVMYDTSRFLVNSTLGVGGLVDFASDMGLQKRQEDFGQTLGFYGINSGPYMVLPFIGPSSVRDTVGFAVDGFTNPRIVLSAIVPYASIPVYLVNSVDTRAKLLETKETLDQAALDKYEFIRDAYLQQRHSLVHDGNPPPQKDEDSDINVVPAAAATTLPAPAMTPDVVK